MPLMFSVKFLSQNVRTLPRKLNQTGLLRIWPLQRETVSCLHYSEVNHGYEEAYEQAMSVENNTYSLPFKSSPADVRSDLYFQLCMGEMDAFEHVPLYLYPQILKTDKDLTNYAKVVRFLELRNPNFIYKLRVSFYFRVMTALLQKKFSPEIDDLQTLACDVIRVLDGADNFRNDLNDIIEQLVVEKQYPPAPLTSLFHLCHISTNLVQIYPSSNLVKYLDLHELSHTIYRYFMRTTSPKITYLYQDHKNINFSELGCQLGNYNCYAMYLAAVVEQKREQRFDGNTESNCPRDFPGYVRCLGYLKESLAHDHVDFHNRDLRLYLSKTLAKAHKKFIDSDTSQYTEEKYYEFLRRLMKGLRLLNDLNDMNDDYWRYTHKMLGIQRDFFMAT